MAESSRHDAWQAGDRYEAYMGRWSRQVAPRFLDWLMMGVSFPESPMSRQAATERRLSRQACADFNEEHNRIDGEHGPQDTAIAVISPMRV